MNVVRFLKPAVFLFECIKILVISTILIVQSDTSGLLIKIVLAAPSALFPIMALFIWLDANRYKEYLPLFIAGKCIGIFLLMGWIIISRYLKITENMFDSTIYAENILIGGDLLSLGIVLLINKFVKKLNMEGK